MESIHVSDLRAIAERAKALAIEAIDEIIDAIDNKILVGDIHRPTGKKPRKKRTRKLKPVEDFPSVNPENEVEKDFPDADKGNTFYKTEPKKKREKKSE